MDQLLLPYKFYGRDMYGICFIIFASCEPLTETCKESTFFFISGSHEPLSVLDPLETCTYYK